MSPMWRLLVVASCPMKKVFKEGTLPYVHAGTFQCKCIVYKHDHSYSEVVC